MHGWHMHDSSHQRQNPASCQHRQGSLIRLTGRTQTSGHICSTSNKIILLQQPRLASTGGLCFNMPRLPPMFSLTPCNRKVLLACPVCCSPCLGLAKQTRWEAALALQPPLKTPKRPPCRPTPLQLRQSEPVAGGHFLSECNQMWPMKLQGHGQPGSPWGEQVGPLNLQ
jgi:hypothetical protein